MFEAGTGAEAVEKAKGATFDLVILDMGLPDTDGRELCRRMRKQGVKCPIVMLTGHDTDADTILGLDSGANDYVTKALQVSGASGAATRTASHPRGIRGCGLCPWSLYVQAVDEDADRRARQEVRLTEKETNILKFLYRAGDSVVPRDVLLHDVWGYNAGVTTHTLETHIYRLRQKIEPDPSNARLLITRSGGYRLVP